ncbi:DNA-binding IclR family transcriptional regulator [Texcoconibacillus texcoconensis]|uniref:DNA-binding IclR family transcriptional regulator n=1 Tax=Texcoconibacillus texcoconensis TaxID=1095777 RepID=A0A840QRB9_9BACI|nr:DNA-binding IclR family transcriptional regulator [Texcoconibacillus texcoconensis]
MTEIANRLNVAKSTAHRILSTLLLKGYVQQDPRTETYSLGLRFIELGHVVLDNLDLRDAARPVLETIAQETGETTHLVVPERDDIVYIDKIESEATIRMFSRVGRRAPLYCTGVGKAILAYLESDELQEIVERISFEPKTKFTITTKEEFLIVLDKVRLRGYSIDDEEHEEGIRCAAAPIFNHEGRVIAGVSIAGPSQRMTDEKLDRDSLIVRQRAQEISAKLGYREAKGV